jgi:hypothetical protein
MAQHQMENRIKSNFKLFQEGQLVWLDSGNLQMKYNKKIAPRQEGQFQIEKVLGPLTYQLKLPESWKIHNIFHAYFFNAIHQK